MVCSSPWLVDNEKRSPTYKSKSPTWSWLCYPSRVYKLNESVSLLNYNRKFVYFIWSTPGRILFFEQSLSTDRVPVNVAEISAADLAEVRVTPAWISDHMPSAYLKTLKFSLGGRHENVWTVENFFNLPLDRIRTNDLAVRVQEVCTLLGLFVTLIVFY